MTGQVQERLQMPPHLITRYMFGPWAMQALKTAIALDIFSAMADGPATEETVSRRLEANPRGISILLEALAGMELLEKNNDSYQLTDPARLYLLPRSELYLGPYIKMQDYLEERWKQLAESVRNGRPQTAVNQREGAEAFFPDLAAAIFPLNFTTAQNLAEVLKAETLPEGSRVLDLAAGSAVWSIPMAQRNNRLRIDALDFPATLATTRRFVEKYGLSERYQYLSGSWQEIDLPDNAYDVILLGHILHAEGREESDRLFEKLMKALKPGGRLVIAEFLTNPERTAPPFALLFGLNMLLATDAGCVFSTSELSHMLEQRGYIGPERLALPFYGEESPVIVAKKPG